MFIRSSSTNSQKSQSPTLPQKLLKEILPHMASDIDQSALDYLQTSQRAEVVNKKRKIGEKSYKYERSKPLSGKLMKELKNVRQTMNYKLYHIRKIHGLT